MADIKKDFEGKFKPRTNIRSDEISNNLDENTPAQEGFVRRRVREIEATSPVAPLSPGEIIDKNKPAPIVEKPVINPDAGTNIPQAEEVRKPVGTSVSELRKRFENNSKDVGTRGLDPTPIKPETEVIDKDATTQRAGVEDKLDSRSKTREDSDEQIKNARSDKDNINELDKEQSSRPKLDPKLQEDIKNAKQREEDGLERKPALTEQEKLLEERRKKLNDKDAKAALEKIKIHSTNFDSLDSSVKQELRNNFDIVRIYRPDIIAEFDRENKVLVDKLLIQTELKFGTEEGNLVSLPGINTDPPVVKGSIAQVGESISKSVEKYGISNLFSFKESSSRYQKLIDEKVKGKKDEDEDKK